MCRASGAKIGTPRSQRRMIDTNTSSSGTASANSGIATSTAVALLMDPCMDSTASMKPMKRLPESPRKMRAGLKL